MSQVLWCFVLASRSNGSCWIYVWSCVTRVVQVLGQVVATGKFFYSCKKGVCGPSCCFTCLLGILLFWYELLLLSLILFIIQHSVHLFMPYMSTLYLWI